MSTLVDMTWLTDPIFWTVLFFGFLGGILATVLGVGGAVITTPAIRAMGATPIAAVGSTVPAILPGAAAGTYRFWKEGYISVPEMVKVGVPGMAFSALGAWVAGQVDARWLMVVTAVLVVWSGISLSRSAPATTESTRTTTGLAAFSQSVFTLPLIGALSGFTAGTTGKNEFNNGVDKTCDERCDHCTERGTDDDTNSEVNHVALHDEIFETL